jgi:D-alanyl-D-alanine carboxypeptidase/D-alanyl-D-alanine-endopeptidase (penicillin-binding protein 4)
MGDGSGLDHADAVPCRTLMAVLDLTHRLRFAPIASGLSVAGERGTLAGSFRATPLAGKLRAKTGTLDGVSGLAGFVVDGRPLTFALLLNGAFGEAAAFSLRESMATTIGQFPQTTGGDGLVPTPSEPIAPRACPHVARAC